MEPFKDDAELIAELHAARPVPSPAFAADLDERAAAGFPRRSTSTGSVRGRLVARLRAVPPRRALFAGGATALAAVVAATLVVAIGQLASLSDPRLNIDLSSPDSAATSSPEAKSATSGHDRSGVQFETAVPTVGAASAPGPFAAKTGHRDVERSAEMVLGTDSSELGEDAAKVLDAVHTYDGIVLSSSVHSGPSRGAGAEFDLLIPSANLGDALAAFSRIAELRSRHEATDDITAPTVGLEERLRDSRATIDGLLVQLAGADTDAERAEVEAQLSAERRHAASLRSRLTKLDRRANLSRVSLRIETGATGSTGGTGGGWGIGDALGDAGHILAIAAAVTIVGLAILGPLAVIALLAWLANRAWVRHRRERALS